MAKPTGYKATRKSIAQRRREARERIWRNADVPPFWEVPLANKDAMKAMLEANQPSLLPQVANYEYLP
jgi:hypothetical protein